MGTNTHDPMQQINVASNIPFKPIPHEAAKKIERGIFNMAPITLHIICNLILPKPLVTFTYIAPN